MISCLVLGICCYVFIHNLHWTIHAKCKSCLQELDIGQLDFNNALRFEDLSTFRWPHHFISNYDDWLVYDFLFLISVKCSHFYFILGLLQWRIPKKLRSKDMKKWFQTKHSRSSRKLLMKFFHDTGDSHFITLTASALAIFMKVFSLT